MCACVISFLFFGIKSKQCTAFIASLYNKCALKARGGQEAANAKEVEKDKPVANIAAYNITIIICGNCRTLPVAANKILKEPTESY